MKAAVIAAAALLLAGCSTDATQSPDRSFDPEGVDDASPAPDPGPRDMQGEGEADVPAEQLPDEDAPGGDPAPGDPEGEGGVRPDDWKDDGWRPVFEGAGGCPAAQHRDPATDDCKPDDPVRMEAEQDCWNGGQVASDGVGRPCHPTDRPCAGLEASCCLVDAKLYGAQCVKPCAHQADCGEGQWCHTGKNVCMRASCRELIIDWYDKHRFTANDGFTCARDAGLTAAVNPLGVGAPCQGGGRSCAPLPETPADEAAAWRADECLGTVTQMLRQGKPSFCTFTCESDDDCGAGATCIASNGPPFFCAPTAACADWFPGKIFRRHPNTVETPCWDPPDGSGRPPR